MHSVTMKQENDIYQQLANHLDQLPGGFPSTESGVELRILRRLFPPEEAALALSLRLIAEAPAVIARRAGISASEAAIRLDEMEQKGLIYGSKDPDGTCKYTALQFIVGIWEFQVNRLTPELVRDVDEYLPHWVDYDTWKKVPQIRSIPVGKAIHAQLEVTSYENAEELINSQEKIAVAPCICRKEQRLVGKGCDRPLETCLSFGTGAEFYVRNGMGRFITREEALQILALADQAGLVLSPGNAQEGTFICACCGCCCGVLRTMQQDPAPAAIVSSPFVAEVRTEKCISCGICVKRCQMKALQLDDTGIRLDPQRCIGCGLCVTKCPTRAFSLVRKPPEHQHPIPKSFVRLHLKLGFTRRTLSVGKVVKLVAKSKIDRISVKKTLKR